MRTDSVWFDIWSNIFSGRTSFFHQQNPKLKKYVQLTLIKGFIATSESISAS